MPDGKICYLEIPATDVEASAEFYSKVFAWTIRGRRDGARAFDDATGGVSGTWVLGRPPARDPDGGVQVHIMVDNIGKTLEKVSANGGQMVSQPTPLGAGGEAYATFRDPVGNVFGLYQEGVR